MDFAHLRLMRNEILSESDKLLLLADLYTDQEISDIKVWRQSLRDATKNITEDQITAHCFMHLPKPPACLWTKNIFKHPSLMAACLDYYFQVIDPNAGNNSR